MRDYLRWRYPPRLPQTGTHSLEHTFLLLFSSLSLSLSLSLLFSNGAIAVDVLVAVVVVVVVVVLSFTTILILLLVFCTVRQAGWLARSQAGTGSTVELSLLLFSMLNALNLPLSLSLLKRSPQ